MAYRTWASNPKLILFAHFKNLDEEPEEDLLRLILTKPDDYSFKEYVMYQGKHPNPQIKLTNYRRKKGIMGMAP